MRREDAARHVAAPAPPAGTSRPPGGAAPAAPPAANAALLARGCALRPGLARPGSARRGPASHGGLRLLLPPLVPGWRCRSHPAEGDAGRAAGHAAYG